MTSMPSRSRRTPATAVLPEAVGPKSASSRGLREVGAGGLLEAMRNVAGGAVRILDDGDLLFGMLGPPRPEPLHGAPDPFVERDLRLVPEQPARLGHVRDVVRHLAEQWWRDRDLGL